MHKAGFISILGYPNVGKSTLVNSIIGENLMPVSPKAQTTRQRVMGIYNDENTQIIFQIYQVGSLTLNMSCIKLCYMI